MRRRFRLPLVLAMASMGLLAAAPPPRLPEAVERQRALAQQNPGDAEVLNDLGNLLALAGHLAEAEGVYSEALRLAPERTSTRYNLALLLQESGKTRRAVREFRQVVKDDPGHAWAHYQLGTLHAESGQRSKALRAYARAFSLDDSLTSVKINPHMVDNHLATEALLLARRSQSPAALAPRLYQQPSRVAGLLMATAPGEETTGEGGEEQAAAQEEEPDEEEAAPGGGVGRVIQSGTQRSRRAPFAGPGGGTGSVERDEDDDDGYEDDEFEEDEEELEDDEFEEEFDGEPGAEFEDDDETPGPRPLRGVGLGTRVITEQDLVPSQSGQVSRPGSAGSGSRLAPPSSRSRTDRGSSGRGSNPVLPSTGRLDLRILPADSDLLAAVAAPENAPGG